MKKYKTIVADPPWPYTGRGPASSKEHRPNSYGAAPSSVERYGSISMPDLKAMPVKSFADDNAHLYLWTTNSFIVEAHELARAWGFEPKTIITWGKVRQEDAMPSMKTGYYFRGATEHLVFAVRGSLRLQGNPEATLFLHPRMEHSRKPELTYQMIMRQSPGPYLEIFARPLSPLFPKREGWDTYGNEMDNNVDLAI